MRCRTCDYPLWELRSRNCPECGTAFLPSEFQFVHESVRFSCPHCAQTYYGTGKDGHLEPDAFSCVRCGNAVTMDEMVLLPAEGVVEQQTRAATVPWVERERGFFGRWFGTIWMAIFQPLLLVRTLGDNASGGAAAAFGTLTNFLYSVTGLALPLFAFGFGLTAAAGGGGRSLAVVVTLLIMLGAPLVIWLAIIVLWAMAAHAILAMTGGADGPLRRTVVAMGYSSAANILIAVPCVGMYAVPVAWIWWGVNATLMIQRCQKVSGLRAAAAVFVPAAVVIGVMVAGVTVWVIHVQRQVATFQAQIQTSASYAGGGIQTETMLQSIVSYASYHGGEGPAHALMLMPSEGLQANQFFIGAKPSVVGGVHPLDVLAAMPGAEKLAAVQEAAAALPEGTVAHRVGEFVYTYHGMDLGGDSDVYDGLWVVIGIPPQAMRVPGQPPSVFVGYVDGTVEPLAIADLPAALIDQNALRADAGLAPLPDPLSVGETQPSPPDEGG